jgi:SAM-dependent methyltransferase
VKKYLKRRVFKILQYSLDSACKEQGLHEIKKKLAQITPDLTKQYTSLEMTGDYLHNKLYSQHAFQISLAQDSFELLDNETKKNFSVVDIGDSSGTHLQYIKALAKGAKIRTLSVNIDPVAVEKIREKGFESFESRAELLHEHPDFTGNANIFLSFEMMEHLIDPVGFLHEMSTKSVCDYFIITVPYVHRSRVGLHHLRNKNYNRPFNAETTHIFELSPEDWDLLFRFSGWKIVKSVRYTQYPKKNPLSLLRYLWRKLDFDGFYGVILEKDDSISKQYLDW